MFGSTRVRGVRGVSPKSVTISKISFCTTLVFTFEVQCVTSVYKLVAQRTIWLLVLISFVVIFVVFLIEPLMITRDVSLIPKIIVVFLAFVIADELSTAFSWREAYNCYDAIDRRVEKILTEINEPSQEAILAIFSDYAVATAADPPIPKRIYKEQWEHLEQSWKDRIAARQTTR
ncbi:hypothetical protein, partial [Candidatus Parabeggiatoa sp. HSG14]|uniref:hypothetical protein n=1 Tax=Candidatus Parabeggiatoa sp. HSG14 TaxID=3055593 RepID=UPI0025A857EE|nr:hypothetical protein [Thiotrichales bacterium HSG14]